MPVSKGRRRKHQSKKLTLREKPPSRYAVMLAACSFLKVLGQMLARTVRPAWHALVSASVIVALVAFAVSVWPRMTVTASGLFDELNAYSETFTITNTGFLPFKNVLIGVGICSIDTTKHDFIVSPNNCEGGTARMLIGGEPSWSTPELRRDEPFSLILSDVLNIATDKYRAAHPTVVAGFKMMSALKAADIIVVVVFTPWPLPWKTEHNYRFVAEEQPNGRMMWRAVPLSWTPNRLSN
jgi:hypothetical protein